MNHEINITVFVDDGAVGMNTLKVRKEDLSRLVF